MSKYCEEYTFSRYELFVADRQITGFVRQQLPRQSYFESVWLGGQDIADEGNWVWTNAGNKSFATDLLWEPGEHSLVLTKYNANRHVLLRKVKLTQHKHLIGMDWAVRAFRACFLA